MSATSAWWPRRPAERTRVISAVHGFAGSPAAVDRAGNEHLMDAAARAGAAFVLLSVVGASAQHPMELFRAHLTLNEVAAIIAQLTGCRSVQHVPRSALRAMAIMTALVKPVLSRQVRAALMMDTTDMSFDSARRAGPSRPFPLRLPAGSDGPGS